MRTHRGTARLTVALLLLGSLVAPSHEAQGQGQSCEELVRYRDGQLFKDWDAATKSHGRTVRKLDVLTEGRQDLLKLRQELQQHSNTVDRAAVYTSVVLTARQVVNGIAAGLDVNPATGLVVKATRAAGRRFTASQIETALSGGELIQGLVEDEAVEVAAQQAAGAIPVVGGALVAIWEFANYVRDMKEIDDTRKVTSEQLRRVDAAIAKIEEQISQLPDTQLQMAALKRVEEGINLYCARSREARKPASVCDLTGTWDNALARGYAMHLRSDGGRVTGHSTGPNIARNSISGEVRSDGTVTLQDAYSVLGVPAKGYHSLRVDSGCSKLEGTYEYRGGWMGSHNSRAHWIKQ